MQRYSVFYRTVQYALFGSIHNSIERYFRYVTLAKKISKHYAAAHAVWSPWEKWLRAAHCSGQSRLSADWLLGDYSGTFWLALRRHDQRLALILRSAAATMASERDADYDADGKRNVNKQTTVCKHCFASVGYATGNTTNMFSHLRRHHPSVSIGRAWSMSASRCVVYILFILGQALFSSVQVVLSPLVQLFWMLLHFTLLLTFYIFHNGSRKYCFWGFWVILLSYFWMLHFTLL